jgi:S-adenosylhomocysteine hydrolase
MPPGAAIVAKPPPRLEGTVPPVTKLYELVLRAAPPGTSGELLGRAINALLRERGLPELSGRLRWSPDALPGLPADALTPSEHYARTVARLMAEYASAAPSGAGEKQIVARLLADYPTLTARRLRRYRNEWERRPEAFPELAPWLHRGTLRWSGLGERIEPPCFLGGWDLRRAVGALAPAERAELARLTQFARIPPALQMLSELVAELDGRKPLANRPVLWVTHMLADVFALGQAMRAAGVPADSSIIVGSPYGSNAAVRESLAALGFETRVPELDPDAYRAAVARAVDDMVARWRKNQKSRMLVVDDGGLVSEILHADPKYADVLDKVRIVEQTTGGILRAEQEAPKTAVVNVARSRAKAYEGKLVADSIVARILVTLERQKKSLAGLKIGIVGGGVVGAALARALASRGAKVVVVEKNAARAAALAPIPTAKLDDVIGDLDLLLGATGTTSITAEHIARMKDGAAFGSVSSKRVEAEMREVERRARSRRVLVSDNPLVTLPTVVYDLGGKKITAIGDGWPLNFDGWVEGVPPRKFQLVDAALLAALFQAGSARDRAGGVVPFEADAKVLARYRELEPQLDAPVSGPDAWLDDLARVGALVTSGA